MYISGENMVVKPYTPVDAYAVMPMADGIISGGTGDDNVVVGETRFFWVYDPNNLSRSGFTGLGWFCGVKNTPLANITEEQLLSEFELGVRTDLNDMFSQWQILVNNQPADADYVKDFIDLLYRNSDPSTGSASDCYSMNWNG